MSTNREPVFSVSEATEMINALFSSSPAMQAITVRGEISNFVAHRSGHCYFTLKDANATMQCVMFRRQKMFLDFTPKNGMQIDAVGRIGVYAQRGNYQLYVEKMKQQGSGDLFEQFEKLKKKLAEEGLFNESQKQAIPKFPTSIGIVTSLTAAALQDILNVIHRRYADLNLVISAAQVQGQKAAPTIIDAIDRLERFGKVDLILLCRGGGSYEDLFVFNDEQLARRISKCKIPVITGIGHETDFTIADFTADLRAPTPSAAAELATEAFQAVVSRISDIHRRLTYTACRIIDQNKRYLDAFSHSRLSQILQRKMEIYYQQLDDNMMQMNTQMRMSAELYRSQLNTIERSLQLLHPDRVMQRGFIAAEKEGNRIISHTQLSKDDMVKLRFSDGTTDTRVL